MKKLVCAILLTVLWFGCAKKTEETTGNSTQPETQTLDIGIKAQSANSSEPEPVPVPVAQNIPQENKDFVPSFEPHEVSFKYMGTGLITEINSDGVGVHASPSIDSVVRFKLNSNAIVVIIGMSKEKDTIGEYEGHWAQVVSGVNNIEYFSIEDFGDNIGWVFSKYMVNGDFPVPESDVLATSQNSEINGGENSEVAQKKYFRAYTKSIEDSDFHYTSIPGIYVRYSETNEVEHIAYLWQNFGSTMESRGISLTDDFEYVLKDLGTSPGIRGIQIFRVADGREIFSGNYYRDFHLTGHTIEVAYSKSSIERGRQASGNSAFDKEIKNYFADFEAKVALPDDVSKTDNEQIIICELNLNTLEQKIIRGEYIGTQ